MKRHVNVPIFVPHLGCPNQCVFCNQHSISGRTDFSLDAVRQEIETVLSTSGNMNCEIAFFGGSFTGIERQLMISLLNLAENYVENERVSGIRMSTRPDYITPEIIEILSDYSVSAIEIGVQSMNDSVLQKLKRGHTTEDTRRAFQLLRDAEISTVGQMMVGLPFSTAEDELQCAEDICALGASAARIYPTVVFKGTELFHHFSEGTYSPLSVEEAVERAKDVLKIFIKNGVPCIRIGLCENENLHSHDMYAAGPNHSALGELVMSAVYRDFISQRIPNNVRGKVLTVTCSKGAVSKVSGQHGRNKTAWKKKFGFSKIKISESEELEEYNVKIDIT